MLCICENERNFFTCATLEENEKFGQNWIVVAAETLPNMVPGNYIPQRLLHIFLPLG